METVQIKCGSCGRVMAISVEHLGIQVHCPHCSAIVQAPPGVTPSHINETRVPEVRSDLGEMESIFSGPEPTDDIFNSGPTGPLVEMPFEKISRPTSEAPSEDSVGTLPFPTFGKSKVPDFHEEEISERTKQSVDQVSAGAPANYHDSDLAAMPLRRVAKGGALAPILLIFLIPYALLATGVIAYLLLNQPRPFDPLERLPDPKPKDGGPRLQVAHDSPLPARLKTRLNQPLSIGALQVTPLKVQLNNNDLVLSLKMKNVSQDQIFNPISDEFMKAPGGKLTNGKPYTFLDGSQKKLFGGFTEWLKGPEQESFNGEIGPGQEELIRIVTMPKYQDDVKQIANSREPLLWRVHVRRGFVDVRGNLVSATAVVGVEFNAKDIEKS